MRISRVEEFHQQSTPPRTRNKKKRLDPANMEAAGVGSLERINISS